MPAVDDDLIIKSEFADSDDKLRTRRTSHEAAGEWNFAVGRRNAHRRRPESAGRCTAQRRMSR